MNNILPIIARFAVLGLLWLGIVAYIVMHTTRITFYTLFVIVASGIIVFVPMYKKYVKNGRRNAKK